MNFSSILDISSFFIGMIINLILVSLMCYYFKRKYEILEIAQTEQAKILYDLLRKDSLKKTETFIQTLNEEPRVDYTKDPLLKPRVIDSDSESESDSDSECEIEILASRNTPPGSPPDLSQTFEVPLDEVKLEEWTSEPVVLEVETQLTETQPTETQELKSDTKEIVLEQIAI